MTAPRRAAYGPPRDNQVRTLVLNHVREHPGQTCLEIAAALTLTGLRTRALLHELRDEGLVYQARPAARRTAAHWTVTG